jgi:tRNA pseudouridine32 synthase
VNKPAAVPVHVAGQYRKNTVVGILEAERPDLGPLAPCHRLDKPVSGVLILTRNAAAAEHMRRVITEHRVTKSYVALVEGAFSCLASLSDAKVYRWQEEMLFIYINIYVVKAMYQSVRTLR